MTSNSSKYGINDTVEVFGFPTKCAHLNGKVGTITGFNPKTMNSTVKFNGKYTTIPEGNMRPATTAAAASSLTNISKDSTSSVTSSTISTSSVETLPKQLSLELKSVQGHDRNATDKGIARKLQARGDDAQGVSIEEETDGDGDGDGDDNGDDDDDDDDDKDSKERHNKKRKKINVTGESPRLKSPPSRSAAEQGVARCREADDVAADEQALFADEEEQKNFRERESERIAVQTAAANAAEERADSVAFEGLRRQAVVAAVEAEARGDLAAADAILAYALAAGLYSECEFLREKNIERNQAAPKQFGMK